MPGALLVHLCYLVSAFSCTARSSRSITRPRVPEGTKDSSGFVYSYDVEVFDRLNRIPMHLSGRRTDFLTHIGTKSGQDECTKIPP
jgi:hypothetical protein